MKVQAARIPSGGVQREGEEPSDMLDLEASDELRVDGPIHYDLHIQVATLDVVASGSVSVPMSFCCVRCAQWFSREIRDDAFLCSLPFTVDDESVDLTPEIREAIILALSAHPVCSQDCKGLCPQCGKNLNDGECGCTGQTDKSWSALDGLKLEE